MTNDELRAIERESIYTYVQRHHGKFTGRTLDYGAGKQPFRDIVERAGGVYIPYDRHDFPANVSGEDLGPDEHEWGDIDAILCTQMLQYVPDPAGLLGGFHELLQGGQPGVLVLTGPTNWPEVEPDDLHRFTVTGIEALLHDVGFVETLVEPRAYIECGQVRLSVGYGAVALA